MVHPAGLTGKTTHSLIDILDAFVGLIEREYNKDANYRDPIDPPFRDVLYGEPFLPPNGPVAAVQVRRGKYEDAPQDAGSDNEFIFEVFLYGQVRRGLERQQKEAIRMAEAVRHIILDNKTLPNAEGTEQVFQAGYGQIDIEFETYIKENMEETMEVAKLVVPVVVAEKGF